MALRRTSKQCLRALCASMGEAGASLTMATGSQQPQLPGAVQPAFRRLMAGMRLEAARLLSAGAGPRQAVPGTGGSSTAFTPSRLYPRRRDAGEAAAFWGLAAANLGVLVLGKAGGPDVTAAILTHARVSVESLAAGRLYTLLTCGIAHTSVWHAAANMGMLLLYRHVLPLSARELLMLYALGTLTASVTHVICCWLDAAGPEYGLRYAINTPGLLGCSGAAAAVCGYKALLNPMAMPRIGSVPVPLPLCLALFLYCSLFIREAEYSDYSGKWGAAAVGLLAAALAVVRGRRRAVWR